MPPSLVKRGPMRRRLRILRRRREALLLDLGALALEMHRHGRFLPDSLHRRAAEAVGTDAELRALSRALDAGEGMPDLVAAGIAGNCDRCGALHPVGVAFCSQCGNELHAGVLPRKAALGRDPQFAGGAAPPRRAVPPAPLAKASRPEAAPEPAEPAVASVEAPPKPAESAVASVEAPPKPAESAPERVGAAPEPVLSAPDPATEPEAITREPPAFDGPSSASNPPGEPPPPLARRARAARVRQRLDEPARSRAALPTGLLAGILAGAVVIAIGVLVLSRGGDAGSERSAQTPAQREPEPPPPDEVPPAGTPGDSGAAPPALEPIAAVSADAYDPSGDDEEHSEEAPLAVDGNPATAWPTEKYETGSLQKDGVGLSLSPAQAVPARGLDIRTTTPGFDVKIYGAEGERPAAIGAGWTEIASEDGLRRKSRIDLDTAGSDFAHYLIWITKIPADDGKVEISEARLLR